MQEKHGDAAWTVYYFDNRLNRSEISRLFSTEHAAMRHACDLIRGGMRVDSVRGPEGRRISEVEMVAWCKSHRTPEVPAPPPKAVS